MASQAAVDNAVRDVVGNSPVKYSTILASVKSSCSGATTGQVLSALASHEYTRSGGAGQESYQRR